MEHKLAESTDPLDRLEWATYSLERRQQYGYQNRVGLLAVHGFMGLVVGILMAIDGPASSMKDALAHHPWLLNMLELGPLLGGTILLVGLAWRRNLLLEAVGMFMLLVWDLCMTSVIGRAAWLYGHDGNPLTVSTTYPIGVYGGLAALMGVHVVTLYLLIRESRRGCR